MGIIKNTVTRAFSPFYCPLRAKKVLSHALVCLLALLFTTCRAQQKSTNVQMVDGKRYYIHTIEKKQSLYAISKMYKVSLDTLYKLNPELKNGAKANQQIKVPFESTAPQLQPGAIDTNRYLTHQIAKGETIYAISRRYGLSEKQLLVYNPILSQGAKEGQVIIVGEKQKRRGKDKDKELLPAPTPSLQLPVLPVDSSLFIPFPKPVKSLYNVSLLLPFKLASVAELDLHALLRGNEDFPRVPGLSTDFYLGCKKAVDSLSAPGFSINLQLYDIDDNDSAEIARLNNDPAFNSSDLIIGPLYASSFSSLSQKALEIHTPIVSPFTQQNKILFNNIFISKTNPSQYTLLESLADYCIDSLMQNNPRFILMTVSAKDRREENYTGAFKAYFNNRLQEMGRPASDTIQTAHEIEGLKLIFNPDTNNVIIALNNNQVFIADFTTQLAMLAADKNVVLCGWQSVTEMDNIDQEYLNQLQYTFPHQYDVSKRTIPVLDRYYKSQQQTSPTDKYYIGFDVAYYYLKNLKELGPDYVYQLDRLPMETSYMRFNFTRPDFTTGFDNRGVYIFRYKDYQLLKTGWK